MRFDWNVKEEMKQNPKTVLIVKVENADEHLFLLHGFDIHDDDDDVFLPYEYPCYLYIRKSNFSDGYYRTFDKNDVYSTLNEDMFGNKIIRKQIISDDIPKEILLNTINECKLGYAACVVLDNNEHYLAIDDNTLVGDYGYINIDSNVDDELNLTDLSGEPSGERITKIYTAKIVALDNWVSPNIVWEYDEEDDLAKYCNEHNITPEDLAKYFGMKLDK